MCFPAINPYLMNTWEISKMINTIAGEHIPGSIKLNNVYAHAHYRLDSGNIVNIQNGIDTGGHMIMSE
jgi:hypothetical protein